MSLSSRGAAAGVVLAMLVLPLACGQTPAGDRVGGTVVSDVDGHPLAHARLTLTALRVESVSATTTADDQGRFQFAAVSPGKYRITGVAPHYLITSYMQHDNYSTALVIGAGLTTDALVMRLVPGATISGRVTDDSGEPAEQAQVQLYREDLTAAQRVVRVRSDLANDLGEYEFSGLLPGRYYLSATTQPWYARTARADVAVPRVMYRAAIDPAVNVAYPMTFYADAADSDQATALAVSGGQQVSADLHLHAEHALTLTLHSADQPAMAGVQLSQLVFGVEEQANHPAEFGDGTLRVTGLAPGRYEMNEMGGPTSIPVGVVDLTDGPVSMELPKVETAEVNVTVHVDGGGPPEGLQVSLKEVGDGREVVAQTMDKSVTPFPRLALGDYVASVFAGGKRLGVFAVSVNGEPVADRHIRVTKNTVVELSVSPKQVSVEGFAKRAGGAGPGSMVVLVPAGADASAELFRRDQSDLDGSFLFSDVVPGNYIVVAIDDGWPLRWTDMAVMTPYLMKGVPLSVSRAGPATMHLTQGVNTQPR